MTSTDSSDEFVKLIDMAINELRNDDVQLQMKTKVAVIGAGGGIGKPLCFCLAKADVIDELAMYDISKISGFRSDVEYIGYKTKVTSYRGEDQLKSALESADMVVILAGVTLKEGQTRDDLFPINAKIMVGFADAIARHCPSAFVAIVTNPVNSLVPLVVQRLEMLGVDTAKKQVFGVTSIDVWRGKRFAYDLGKSMDVVGGHEGVSIVPITGRLGLTLSQRDGLVKRVREEGMRVLKEKDFEGTATWSMADKLQLFTLNLLEVKRYPTKKVEDVAYVWNEELNIYFSSKLTIGHEGVETNLPFDQGDEIDRKHIEKAIEKLKKDIERAEEFLKRVNRPA